MPRTSSVPPATFEFIGSDSVRLVGDRRRDRSAPAVLLSHGGGQTRHSWDRSAEAVAAAGWQAVTIDLRGHGESGWSRAGAYSFKDLRRIDACRRHASPSARRRAQTAGLHARPPCSGAGALGDAVDELSTDLTEAARSIRLPLLVRGAVSDVVSADDAADFLADIPHARSIDVPAAGHMVAGDQSHASRVLEFLPTTGLRNRE